VTDSLAWQFRFLKQEEIPHFADWGVFYKTIGLDPCLYLHYLQARCLSMGVAFRRGSLDHIHDAFKFDKAVQADVVVNCSGLGACKLGGVMDENVKPMRGQLVVVENESHGQYGISSDDDMQSHIGESCYIIDRPSGVLPQHELPWLQQAHD
jgi:D-amino-acid oxidase